LSSVDACSEAIRRAPEMSPIVHERYRRALIRRFPDALFYEHEKGVVTVYGVLHTSAILTNGAGAFLEHRFDQLSLQTSNGGFGPCSQGWYQI